MSRKDEMSALECGVDLVEIDRFASLDPAIRWRFIARVFTPAEIELCANRDDRLAGRFAAKEAVAKTLGCGIGPVRWQEIEVLADEKQAPLLRLHGRALDISEERRMQTWAVSITHTRDLAMAFAVAIGDPPKQDVS